ncbi:MAG: hypothetical protein ABI760_25850 [Ferruginibacter sp.]
MKKIRLIYFISRIFLSSFNAGSRENPSPIEGNIYHTPDFPTAGISCHIPVQRAAATRIQYLVQAKFLRAFIY